MHKKLAPRVALLGLIGLQGLWGCQESSSPAPDAAARAAGTVHAADDSLIVLAEQGNRPFGGTTIGDPRTGSLACDHGYVSWQIPPDARPVPLLFVHASSRLTWETTFDGRDGFIPIFLRHGFATYTTDLPRTGQAGQGCAPTAYEPEIGWTPDLIHDLAARPMAAG